MASPLSHAASEPRLAPAPADAVVSGPGYRFTVLTDRLIRMESAEGDRFVDAATQLVVNRDLGPVPEFRVVRGENRVEVITEHLHLTYQPSRGFSRSGLQVSLRTSVLNPHGGTWHHGDTWDPAEKFPSNLGGTCRTLDEVDGRAPFLDGDDSDDESGEDQAPARKAPEEITFADLGLTADLLKAVTDMGFTTPTDIQREAIPTLLSGRDVVGVGGGGAGTRLISHLGSHGAMLARTRDGAPGRLSPGAPSRDAQPLSGSPSAPWRRRRSRTR